MHYPAVAVVDGNMVNIACGAEEHQVAFLKLIIAHLSAVLRLKLGKMGHFNAYLRIAQHYQTRTIGRTEARAGPYISTAYVAACIFHDRIYLLLSRTVIGYI